MLILKSIFVGILLMGSVFLLAGAIVMITISIFNWAFNDDDSNALKILDEEYDERELYTETFKKCGIPVPSKNEKITVNMLREIVGLEPINKHK